jgi:uncharacterized protein (DUF433 family)
LFFWHITLFDEDSDIMGQVSKFSGTYSMATIHFIDTIISDPQIRSGHPIIAGTHVRVIDIIASYTYRGLTIEELAVNFAISVGDVHAALAYYYQHKLDMDTQMQAEAQTADSLLAEFEAQGKLIRLG